MQQSNAKLNQAGAILKLMFDIDWEPRQNYFVKQKLCARREQGEKKTFSCFHCCYRVVKYRALPLGNEFVSRSG
jgi:hypothetical protein